MEECVFSAKRSAFALSLSSISKMLKSSDQTVLGPGEEVSVYDEQWSVAVNWIKQTMAAPFESEEFKEQSKQFLYEIDLITMLKEEHDRPSEHKMLSRGLDGLMWVVWFGQVSGQ